MATQIPPTIAVAVSVSDVKLSRDFSYADVFLSAISGVEAAVHFLQGKKGEIRDGIATSVSVHRVPILRFHRDTLSEKATRLDELLASIATVEAKKKRSSAKPRPRKKV